MPNLSEIPSDIQNAEREAQESYDTWLRALAKPDEERSRAEAALVHYKTLYDKLVIETNLSPKLNTYIPTETESDASFTARQVIELLAEFARQNESL